MGDPLVADPIPDLADLPLPPLDSDFFSADLNNNHYNPFDDNEDDDVLNFDFTFDDILLPDTEEFLNSTVSGSIPLHIPSDPDSSGSNQKSPELWPDDPNLNVSGYFNTPSSDGDNKSSEVVTRVSNCDNREVSGPTSSQGSDNFVASSGNNSTNGVVDQKIKVEEMDKNYLLKRKKENDDDDVSAESTRTIKFRRSNNANNNATTAGAVDSAEQSNVVNNDKNDEDEKRKARLMRNRESAQLSRQRKKHYVEELEDKVRAMHSTIQDLNAKISYIVAENVTLRQQMNGGGGGGAVGPPQPIPGMYPHPPMAPMGYPWMPMPPYVVKPQGSQVPLVPIPRLKPQQQATKSNKKGDSKKLEGRSKTKKVASVSFLGLLFFMLLFGGLVPMVNVKYGGTFTGDSSYIRNRFNEQHHGRVLMVNGTNHDSGTRSSPKNLDSWKNYNGTINCGRGPDGGAESNIKQSSSEECTRSGNASEPLVASLFVPRNDKLVKIDGNLIIHSVLASEKAMASRKDAQTVSNRETSLAVALNLAPSVSVPGVAQNKGRHARLYRSTAETQRALASGSAGKDNLKSTPVDGKVQEWFREGLAGPMLSSGMCTEVFQFDASPGPGAIVPATPKGNISVEENKNSTHLNKGRNRRILHGLPIPLPGSASNVSKENAGNNSQKENTRSNSSVSPMIVSVLVDPREVGDGNGDGMIGTKSLSRIFVVVLLDSVKYVTYSCMLPFMGSSHLVTA